MTPWNDVEEQMRRLPLDSRTADRLLTGRLDPDDAPPGYGGAARLLQMARADAAPAELWREQETVAAMAAVRAHRSGRPNIGRSRTMSTSLKLKIAASALVVALMGSAGLAVAGALPGPAQKAAAHVLARIGVSAPGVSDHRTHSPASDNGAGPDATGPAKFGLCTAFASGQGGINGGKDDSVAFRNLQAAADAAGQSVEAFCAGATPGGGASNGHAGIGSTHEAGHRGASTAGSRNGGRSSGSSVNPHRP